jgi:hypothetical protein
MRRRGFLKGVGVAGSTLAAGELLAGSTRGGAGAAVLRAATAARSPSAGLARLKGLQATLRARLSRHEAGQLARSIDVALDPRAPARAELDGATWSCALKASPVRGRADATDLLVTFRLLKGAASAASVGVALTFSQWSRDNYLLLPGACYNGNRFESRHISYPPLLTEPADIGPNVPTIISDVPRLNVHAGPSRIQLLTGDLATPAVGFQSPRTRTGVWILTDQATPLGNTGISVIESPRGPDGHGGGDGEGDGGAGGSGGSSGAEGAAEKTGNGGAAAPTDQRQAATFLFSAPGVRQDYRYALGNTRLPSKDEGVALTAGAEVVLRVRLYAFDCAEVQGLFDRFVAIRKDLSGPTRLRHELPFSSAWKIHEEKYNRQNWVERYGYYASGLCDSIYTSWQTGWGGGLIATQALLFAGEARSRERALRNFDFVFDSGQARSGFFHGISDGRAWFEDGFAIPVTRPAAAYKHAKSWHLVRRSADVLYFMMKQLALLEKQDRSFKPKPTWTAGLRACADAFVRLWDKYHQLGQFVNIDTGQLIIGGSTSAAVAPAGLALASRYFNHDDYLRVAEAAARHFHERFVSAGLTTGGPGDALQCPDSESAAGLLESSMVLHEITGDAGWVDQAVAAAHQVATWAMSYDYSFPVQSPCARLGIRSTGAIIANAQNKHGSPGFFLHSGDALLKLYRASGNVLYLDLLRDTAHNVTQYLSRADHLLHPKSEPGWMCERINTSDWLDPVGEILPSASPFDICSMLTAIEVPGLYVHPDSGFVYAFDHVDAVVKEKSAKRLLVTVTNPTRYEAALRVLAENRGDLGKPLGANALWGGRVVTLAPGETQPIEFDRGDAS